MNKKKHIDRLFQDKLQNFEATPSDAVWENINAKLSLEKEKDRKVIPFWLKIAGIAASLILLFTLSNALFFDNDDSNTSNNEVVNTEKNTDSNILNEDKNPSNNNADHLKKNDAVLTNNSSDDDTNSNITTRNQESVNSNTLINQSNNNQKSNIVTISQGSKIVPNKNGNVNQKQNSNTVVENTFENLENNTPQINKNKVKELTNSSKNNNSKNAVTDLNKESTNANDINKQNTTELSAITKNATEQEKLSIQEELNKANEENKVLKDEEKKKRWSVAPNIAPVYFNSLGSGSSIDSKFDDSPKSGQINMSYGVAANYQVNDKLSIRAGINQVKLGYNTNNVIVYNNIEPDTNGKPLRNVALNSDSQNLSFLSSDGLSFGQVPDVVAENVSSSIEQRLGFIEVPVEAEYKLSDKKLGLSLIGGFSTLFLNENEVYSTLQNERQLLGEATNVNKTSFSANFGVGVKYKVSEKINLNLEPVFKYQLNTFSDTSGNFNPYTIGVYTGFSFKF